MLIRDGNGRTIREFIRELAFVNGYLFDLTRINTREFLDASKKSVIETEDLEKIFNACLVEIEKDEEI